MIDAAVWFRCPQETDRFLPEGPRELLIHGRPAIAWVNIQTAATATTGELHYRFLDDLTHVRINMPGRPGFFVPTDRPNTVLAGLDKAIGLFNLVDQQWTPWAEIGDRSPFTIINDGEPTPDGRGVLFGTKDVRFAEPIGHLYLYSLETRTIQVLADRQTCSNGKVINPVDGHWHLYDIDTPTRKIVRYTLEPHTKRIADSRDILDLSGVPGFPDGMVGTVDGGFLVAFYNPDPISDGAAYLFDASGRMTQQWRVPGSPRVTCPLLFRKEGRVQLLLTTATEGAPDAIRKLAPEAGHLFIAPTNLDNIREVVPLRLD